MVHSKEGAGTRAKGGHPSNQSHGKGGVRVSRPRTSVVETLPEVLSELCSRIFPPPSSRGHPEDRERGRPTVSFCVLQKKELSLQV